MRKSRPASYVRLHARVARKEASDVRGQLDRSGLQLLGRDGHVQRETLLVRLFESAELMLQPEALADECGADRPRRVECAIAVDRRTPGQVVRGRRGWRAAPCPSQRCIPLPLCRSARHDTTEHEIVPNEKGCYANAYSRRFHE